MTSGTIVISRSSDLYLPLKHWRIFQACTSVTVVITASYLLRREISYACIFFGRVWYFHLHDTLQHCSEINMLGTSSILHVIWSEVCQIESLLHPDFTTVVFGNAVGIHCYLPSRIQHYHVPHIRIWSYNPCRYRNIIIINLLLLLLFGVSIQDSALPWRYCGILVITAYQRRFSTSFSVSTWFYSGPGFYSRFCSKQCHAGFSVYVYC